jgi:hypothetical protein
MLSFLQELGWGDEPTPIQGFHFTKFAYRGTCIISDALADERVQRALKYDFDFTQPLGDALNDGGAIRQQLPPVDIVIYNRGYRGTLSKPLADQLMPVLYDFSQGAKGR